ncbi:DUF262 domain-containing protein [Naumannella sp. ID2617S]|nr:DUF262 domain-containing protein [Naumannella sp. ID2617S]
MSPKDAAILVPKTVSEISGEYFVPAYQRGYRWGRFEVKRLLDDIVEASGRPYYLQPIVVKPRGEAEWELVDGQQRLTTLYLILKRINRSLPDARPTYRLSYETRPTSAAYLDSIGEESSQENIDFFHMQEAYREIEAWFDASPNPTMTAIDMYTALSKHVRVIWYVAEPEVDSADLFARLNVGRIPLTDAELVKALVLSRIRVDTPDRVHEVAAQWDSIERDLRAPEAWAFISGRADAQASHIGLLLDALAGHVHDRHAPLYETFEKLRSQIEQDTLEFWNEVVDLHSHIVGWYDDRDTYHAIGFLVAEGMDLLSLLKLNEGKTKTQFLEALRKEIRTRLNLTEVQLRDLTYTSRRTTQALLLMNVQTVVNNKSSEDRYSFHSHAAAKWSLEHIHAQHAEQLNTQEQWREWLRLQLQVLGEMPGVDEGSLADIAGQIPPEGTPLRRQTFEGLHERVIRQFAQAGQEAALAVDSISNLALLAGGDNSALSNSPFAVKRQHLIQRDRQGQFIPPCTRNVFLKYYTTTKGQQNHFWSTIDREDYLSAMVDVLRPYLTAEEDASDDE